MRLLSCSLIAFSFGTLNLQAGVTLLIGEPFGKFGSFNPTGHAAVYLSRICAETPTELRRCREGETGVIVSRYNRVGGFDWVAVPPLPYFYAVERPEEVPAQADGDTIAELRDRYRRQYLQDIASDGPEGEMPRGDWIQLVGSAYDRTIYGFSFSTLPEDDNRLIEHLNGIRNQRRFNLFYRNCADFARSIINFYQPRALGRSYLADCGITTPKHLARALVRYTKRRPELDPVHYVVHQLPGTPPSGKVRGVSESLVRSKRYAAPLLFFQPWVAGSAAIAYLANGRFDPSRQPHTVCGPEALAVSDCRQIKIALAESLN